MSVSTLGSTINAVRGAIGDSGEAQRLIKTLPRKGFRFVGAVSEQAAPPPTVVDVKAHSTPAINAEVPTASGGAGGLAPLVNRPVVGALPPVAAVPGVLALPVRVRKTVLAAGLAFGLVAAIFYLARPESNPRHQSLPMATQKFDPVVVPLVSDEARRSLQTYAARPDIKVLAIGSDQFSVVDNAVDVESAKQQALNQCSTRTTRCRIYAVGTEVIWSKESLPMAGAGDLRTEPLAIPLVPSEIPTLNSRRRELVNGYMKGDDHRAMALATGRTAYVTARGDKAEAARLAVERCSERVQRPCLILSVNGSLTIQIPKTRRVDRIFLPSAEEDIPDGDKARVSQVYRGREWRALARGKNGSWHAVADEPSEVAAIEQALANCTKTDDNCRLYAIGNFRVVTD